MIAAMRTAGVADGRVYDYVPDGAVSPYVVLGESNPVIADVQERLGVDELITLHIWDVPKGTGTHHRGQKRVKEVGAQIQTALHAEDLTADGRSKIFVTVRDMRVIDDPDGLTKHGVLTLRVQHFGE